MNFSSLTSKTGVLWTVAGVAVIVHLIFKRTETFRFFWLFILLLATPASLTVLFLPYVNNSLILAVLNVFGLFWSTLVTSILLYRLSPWHPLAKYPGPLICKLTKFYLAFLSLRGRQHIYYSRLHKKYGDVVRVGPNELSICNVNAVAPLMGPNGLEKGPFWSGRVPQHETVRTLIAIVDKTEHARRRRAWTRAFSSTALKGYEDLVKDRTLQLVDTLASKNLNETQNITEWFAFFAYDTMMDLAFGGGSEMIRDGDPDGIWHVLEGGQKELFFMSHVPWLSSITFFVPGFLKNLKAFRANGKDCARRRVKEGSTRKDLFYHLIDEDNLATIKPTIPEVMSDGALAVLAGSDTTSSAATNIIYFLISHPTAYKRLQAEIDGLGNKLTDCTTQAHLPYLNAVIHEGLRLLPPVLSGVQRASEKGSGGRMVGSVFLPEGCSAFVHTYSLQRDSRYFSLPDSFIPERWLPEDQRQVLEPKIFNSEIEFIHNTAAFIPFSTGPANCAGKNFAWIELRMVVTLMASRFDLAFEPGYNPLKWYDDIGDYFIMLKGELPVRLSIRKA